MSVKISSNMAHKMEAPKERQLSMKIDLSPLSSASENLQIAWEH